MLRMPRILLLFLVAVLSATPAVPAKKKPIAAKKPSMLRTYRFTAKISDNGGITPLEVGRKITGEFTYDLLAKNITLGGALEYARYESKNNRIVFKYGPLRFKAYGRIRLNVGAGLHSEHFGITSNDLTMPKGWHFILPMSGRKNRSRTFSIVLQNSPTRDVLPNVRIPRTLKLSDFVSSRELRFDFFFGLRYPGGVLKKRTVLKATLESLTFVTDPVDAKD